MPSPPMLTGGARYQQQSSAAPLDFKSSVIDLDPDGWDALPQADQMEVGETFFQNHYENNSDFQALPEADRQEVRQTFFKNNFHTDILPAHPGQHRPPKDLRPQGWEAVDAQLKAQVNNFRNQYPLAANAYDLLTPMQGMADGALQGLSAGGYHPKEQANENWIRHTQRGLGQLAGSAVGFLGTAPVLTPIGAGALYGMGGDLNQQLDEGKNLQNMNYARLGAQTAFGGATGVLPGTFGNKVATRIAAGAGLGGALGAAPVAIDQYMETGQVDLTDPTVSQAFLQGAGVGIGSALMPGVHSAREQRFAQARAEAHRWVKGGNREPLPIGLSGLSRVPAPPEGALQGSINNVHVLPEAPSQQVIPTQVEELPPFDHRQTARDLYDMMKSKNRDSYLEAMQQLGEIRKIAQDKRTRSGKIYRPGDPDAKAVLAELEIYKQELKEGKSFREKPEKVQEGIVQSGLRMRQTPTGKALFDAEISKNFKGPEKGIIYGRIKEAETTQAQHAKSQSEKAKTRRERGIAKRKEILRQRQAEKAEFIRKENERIKAELEAQRTEEAAAKAKAAEEAKTQTQQEAARKKRLKEIEAEQKKAEQAADAAKKKQLADEQNRIEEAQKQAEKEARIKAQQKSMPKVLEPEQIEAQAEQLLKHYKANEKGTLDAKVTQYRKIARTDYEQKRLATKARTEAIQETHAKVLDRFYQKKAQHDAITAKPTIERAANTVKAKQENMKDLEAIKAAGGDYDMQTGKGIQRPARPDSLSWEDVRDYIDPNDPAYKYAETIGEAMRKDGDVTIRYDSERGGDTGSFEYKRVSPVDFGFNFSRDTDGNITDAKLVFHGVNENGHTGEYYIHPSDANPKTGTISAILEDPILHTDSFGKAKRNGESNVYYGPREFSVSELMNRPARKTVGLTSELQAQYAKARQLLDAVEQNRQPGMEKTAIPAKALKQAAKQSKALRDSLAKADGEQTPQGLQELAQDLRELSESTKRNIDESTGC